MFSVVIPLYNKELSISNTIQSVLDQTFQEFEIVIVNDGSTDKSVEVVEGIKDERIRLIHQENQGVSAARNKGIEEAKYEWIAFLDGDDEWYLTKLNLFNTYLTEHSQVKWGFAGYDIYKNKKLRRREVYVKSNLIVDNIFNELLKGIKIQTSSVIVKKSFLLKNRIWFTVGINNSEDQEVWYKLCCCDKRPLYISESLSKYINYSHQESLTKTYLNNKKIHFLSMKNRLEGYLIYAEEADRKKLDRFLDRINRKAIYNFWSRLRYLPIEFEDVISKTEYKWLLTTVKLPQIVKKVIIKVMRKLP